MSKPYPDVPFLSGNFSPWTMEGEIRDCVVEGEIPLELRGTYYRNGANPQFAPPPSYHVFDGDGMIHGFHLEDGRCRYWNRWVETERFLLERRLGRSAFGGMMPGEEPDPAAAGVSPNAANTNVFWHAGRLLALWEGGPPYALDPDTLDTRGICDFDGKLTRPGNPALGQPEGAVPGSFTAHPKVDPITGEMLFFGYSFFSPQVSYGVVDAQGQLTRLVVIDVPYASMMHDFVVTDRHVIFPIFPAVMNLEQLAESGIPIAWDPTRRAQIGVMPRDGNSDDVIWIETDPCHVFHFMNAHSEGNSVVIEACRFERLPLFGEIPDPAQLHRWTLDLDARSLQDERLFDQGCDFPRVDPRRAGLPYGQAWGTGTSKVDLDHAVDLNFDSLLHFDLKRGTIVKRSTDPGDFCGEPVFVPRSPDAAQDEGFLLSIIYRAAQNLSELLILDAQNIDREPLATVKLPHRIPFGFHGNWRPV